MVEDARAEFGSPVPPGEFWYARHACGHSIYWSDRNVANSTSNLPCPWCGGESGKKVPQKVSMLADFKINVFAFPNKLPDGNVPWPLNLANAPKKVILRHRADGNCCSGEQEAATPDLGLEAQARAFVERYARGYGFDPDEVWLKHRKKLFAKDVDWFTKKLEQEELLSAERLASLTPGRNSLSVFQWPDNITEPNPAPVYKSFRDYFERTTLKDRMTRCRGAANKGNRERLLSDAPKHRLSGADVWNVLEAAQGRCAYCGSLAVEKRPSKPNGAPIAWAQMGRRIGSLEHRNWRAGGGDNDLANLAWCCLWCNTWTNERKPGSTDYGGFYPLD